MKFSSFLFLGGILACLYFAGIFLTWRRRLREKESEHLIMKAVDEYQFKLHKLKKSGAVIKTRKVKVLDSTKFLALMDGEKKRAKADPKQEIKEGSYESVSAEDKYFMDAYLSDNKIVDLKLVNLNDGGFCIKDEKSGMVIFTNGYPLKRDEKRMFLEELNNLHKNYWKNMK